MSWTGCNNASSYTIYKDETELATVTGTSFYYENASYGTHDYYVKANYSSGQSHTSNVEKVSIAYNGPELTDFNALAEDDDVSMSWTPLTSHVYYFQHFSEGNPSGYKKCEKSSSTKCGWLELFPTKEISERPGTALYSVNVYIAPNAVNKTHTIYFYTSHSITDINREPIYSFSFIPESEGWINELISNEANIVIDNECDLIVYVEINDNDKKYAAYCSNNTISTNSYLVEEKESIAYRKIDSDEHWLINLGVHEPNYSYNVYRVDLQTRDTISIVNNYTESSYTDINVPDGVYNYYITANMFEGESAPSNSATVFVGDFPAGATPGIFSVSHNTYAYFSQGNLQYQASTNTWRFAEHQWDFVGGYDSQLDIDQGNVYENGEKCDNSLVSETYAGWIDLFGWGTSGYNHGSNCYQPWSTSEDPQDYVAYGMDGLSLYEGNRMADWGYNPIVNGGNEENIGWRTPTASEWDYLLNTRPTPSGLRYAFAVVNNVNGMILLPDNWNAAAYTLSNPNVSNFSLVYSNRNELLEALYNSNNIDETTWAEVFEPNGVVFIPSDYYRFGTDCYSNGGGVWSSSSTLLQTKPFFAYLDMGFLFPWGFAVTDEDAIFATNVRLIKDVTNMYMVSVSCGQGGSIEAGEGAFEFGNSCTVEAEASEGYVFSHWTENGIVVSTDPSYTFGVFRNHQLVAHFKSLEEEDPDLLEGLFSVSEDHVARFAKGNLNLDFQFHAGGSTNVEWSFAEHQWDCKNFNSRALLADYEGYMETNGMDLIYGRYIHDVNNGEVVLDLDCWSILSPDEWEYLLHQRITASGMHYCFCSVNDVYGMVLFPDDWNASTYALPYNAIDVDFTNEIDFVEVPLDDWNAFFEPSNTVFLPLSFEGIATNNPHFGGELGVESLNYSYFSCSNGYYDDEFSYHDGYVIAPSPFSERFEAGDGFSLDRVFFGYERPVQIESRDFEVVGAQSNPLWAGEVNGGGIFEHQMRSGDVCTLTATANSGHAFEGWYESGDFISNDSTLSFVVDHSRFFEAQYSADEHYQIYADAFPLSSGYVDGAGQYEEWQECQLVAEADEHYHFIGWMEDDSIVSTSIAYSFLVTRERHLKACFAENQFYLLTATAVPEEGGLVYLAANAMSLDHSYTFSEECEETVNASIIANANEGFHFSGWMVGDSLVSMDNIYNFPFPSEDVNLEAHFEYCEVDSEPDPALLNGRFSISACATVGFAKGNVVCKVEQTDNSMQTSWDFASTQCYRKNYGNDGPVEEAQILDWLKNGMDLVPNMYEYNGKLDFSCWHLLSSEEWNYLLNSRDMEVRFAFGLVNNIEGLLVMPDDWDPSTYEFESPNEVLDFSNNIISRYDWNTILEPEGVLFLPANGMIFKQTDSNYDYTWSHMFGCYTNLLFVPAMGLIFTDVFAPEMPQLFSSMRLAKIIETSSPVVTVGVAESHSECGTVYGGGEYACGSTITVSAFANEGYVFRYWLNGDEVVSTEANYSFGAVADCNLIAEFADENEVCDMDVLLSYGLSYADWLGNAIQLSFETDAHDIRLTIPGLKVDWYDYYLRYGNTNDLSNLDIPDYMEYTVYVNRGDLVTVSFYESPYLPINSDEAEFNFAVVVDGNDTIISGNALTVLPYSFVRDCELLATQSGTLMEGWNWWTPIVSTTIENIQTKLNSNLVQILEQEGIPSGDVIPGKMYKIETNADCSLIIRGTPLGSAEIIIYQGINWFGFIGTEKTVAAAFAGFSPALGDKVISQDGGFAIYNGSSWQGTLVSLVPGKGYVYVSNDTTPKTLVIGQ